MVGLVQSGVVGLVRSDVVVWLSTVSEWGHERREGSDGR